MSNFASYDNLAEIFPYIKSSKVIPLVSGQKRFGQMLIDHLFNSEYETILIPTLVKNLAGTQYVSFNAPNSSGVGPIKMVSINGSGTYHNKYVGVKVGGTYNAAPSFEMKNVAIRWYKNANTGVITMYLMGNPSVWCGLQEYYGANTTKIVIGDGSDVEEETFVPDDTVDYTIGSRLLEVKNGLSNMVEPSPGSGTPFSFVEASRIIGTYDGTNFAWNLRIGGAGIYLAAVQELMERHLFIQNDSGPYIYQVEPGSYGNLTASNFNGLECAAGYGGICAYLLKQ